MVWIPGGEFSMGGVNPVGMNDGGHEAMNDARPVHRVRVNGFLMDATEVTNKQFAEFVKATGYVTVAEQKPTREEFPEAAEENLVAVQSFLPRSLLLISAIPTSGGVMFMALIETSVRTRKQSKREG